MKRLVSPAEVLTIAFGTTHTLRESDVPDHTILAAERKFLLPVLGVEFFDRLVGEEPTTADRAFAENYLKMPLALYVASLLLPTIALQVGAAGVVRVAGESFRAADERCVVRLCRRLRSDAGALLDSATDYLAAHPDLYPLYQPQNNVRKRISLNGGVIV